MFYIWGTDMFDHKDKGRQPVTNACTKRKTSFLTLERFFL